MIGKHQLQKRLTHKYVGEYQHEDEWEDIGTFEVLAIGQRRPDDEGGCAPCDPITTTAFGQVTAEGDVNAEDIERALHDTFTSWGCACEYDCCGCRSYQVEEVEELSGRYWKVVVNSSRNY